MVDTVSAAQLRDHARRLLSKVQVVALSHGNLDASAAERMGTLVHDELVAQATPVEVPRGRVVRLRRGDRLGLEVAVDHPESAVVLYVQGPDKRLVSRARAGLAAQILGSDFFDVLRTQKKLGYVVFANAFPILDSAGMVFIVQSPVAGAHSLQKEVHQFLTGYEATVDSMSEADFAQHKRALVARVMEEERQLGERSARFWEEIDRGNFEFDTRERLVDAIEKTDLAQFKRFYAGVLAGAGRRELAVRATGETTPALATRPRGEQPVSAAWARRFRGLLPG